ETHVARVTQFPYNHRIGDTAFGYQYRLLREQANHPERLFQIGHETAQVTVVDADQAVERRDIIRLPLIVQLQQDIQLQLMCQLREPLRLLLRDGGGNQQDGTGTCQLRLEQLVLIHDKLFP